MLLNLSIELTSAHGRMFNVQILKNQTPMDTMSFEVADQDVVTIMATGKGQQGTEVSETGEILSDISLTLQKLVLGGVEFDTYGLVTAVDLEGNPLKSNASLYADGKLVICIDTLLHSHYNYESVPMLTLEQVALEVLGRPTSLKL